MPTALGRSSRPHLACLTIASLVACGSLSDSGGGGGPGPVTQVQIGGVGASGDGWQTRTRQLTAAVRRQGVSTTIAATDSVTWTSSNPTSIPVSDDPGTRGGVSFAQPGEAWIYASYGGVKDSVRLRTLVVARIDIIPANPVLPVGSTVSLRAYAIAREGVNAEITDSVAWTSTDSAAVWVSSDPGSRGNLSRRSLRGARISVEWALHVGVNTLDATCETLVTGLVLRGSGHETGRAIGKMAGNQYGVYWFEHPGHRRANAGGIYTNNRTPGHRSTVVSGLNAVNQFDVDDDFLLWSEWADPGNNGWYVRGADLHSDRRVLFTGPRSPGGPGGVDLEYGSAWWADQASFRFRQSSKFGSPGIGHGPFQPTWIVVHNGQAFGLGYDSRLNSDSVVRVLDYGSGTVRTLATGQPGALEGFLDRDHFYWVIENQRIMGVRRYDPNPRPFVVLQQTGISAIAPWDGWTYYQGPPTTLHGGSIMRIPSTGGTPEVVLGHCEQPGRQFEVLGIRVEDDRIYLTDAGSGRLLAGPR
ncbi:MAG TPA: hypothetical protein VF006_31565 [Longimicrobium sp.]